MPHGARSGAKAKALFAIASWFRFDAMRCDSIRFNSIRFDVIHFPSVAGAGAGEGAAAVAGFLFAFPANVLRAKQSQQRCNYGWHYATVTQDSWPRAQGEGEGAR